MPRIIAKPRHCAQPESVQPGILTLTAASLAHHPRHPIAA